MGQKQINPYTEYEKQYMLVSTNQKQQLLVRHKQNGKQYMLRKIVVNSEQELEQRMNLLNRRKKIKNEHILNIVDYKPMVDYKICGHNKFISLLIQYPFESLSFQTLHRMTHISSSHRSSTQRVSPLYFQQHQLWSILYSCALGLEVLYLSDLDHQSITKDIIFIDREGVVKIGDPIILSARKNFQNVIQLVQKQKSKLASSGTEQKNSNVQRSQSLSSSNFYSASQNGANYTNFKKLNYRRQQNALNANSNTPSYIISPQLISFCKDHQYYFYDKQKSDVYILGALLIQLALLDNVASVNVQKNIFKRDLAQYTKADGGKLRQRYSNAFVSILEEMTHIDPKQRSNLNQIIEKIQQFSIQENSKSDLNNSVKNNSFDGNNYINPNPNDLFKKKQNAEVYSPQAFNAPLIENKYLNSGYNNNSYNPSVTNSLNFSSNYNNYTSTNNQNSSNLFPNLTFNNLNNKPPNQYSGNYHQSAVKTLFSKNPLPVQIKYTQSPLIVPVSNIKNQKKPQTYSTPFHHLNLTQSNEKSNNLKQTQKESIVQNKFTFQGGNINSNSLTANSLFQQTNSNNIGQSGISKPYESQRFSMNKFGKIELPSAMTFNNSQNTSIHTSTLPTPRFQNLSSTLISSTNQQRSTQKIADTNYSLQSSVGNNLIFSTNNPTFQLLNSNSNFSNYLSQTQNSQPPLIQSTNNLNSINNIINPFANDDRSSSYRYMSSSFGLPKEGQKINSNYQPYSSFNNNQSVNPLYNPKKQGFSIIDEQDLKPIDKKSKTKEQPYFSNSSVGYTLPKYRPDSSSSQVVKSGNSFNQPVNNQLNSKNTIISSYSNGNLQSYSPIENEKIKNLGQKIPTQQSFVQKVDIPQPHRQLARNSSNASSMINQISSLANDKNDDSISNSSQNTVKKQNASITINNTNNNSGQKRTNSSQKKYTFYKSQMNQKLQKIQQVSSRQISINHATNQNIKSKQLPNNSHQATDKKNITKHPQDKQHSLSHISSISVIQQVSPQKTSQKNSYSLSNQNLHSPIYQQNISHNNNTQGEVSEENSIIPVVYQPQIHSVYVEEKEEDGAFYKGFKVNNQRQGQGILYFADGGYYEGQFSHDGMNGYGKLYNKNQNLAYEGQFVNNQFHGYGVLYNDKPKPLQERFDFANFNQIGDYWGVYKGYFKQDQKSGKCTIVLTNGQQFQGYCQNNTIEGHGRFKTLHGQYIDGIWKNNVLVDIKNQGRIQDLNRQLSPK